MNIKPFVFSVVALMGASAPISYAAPASTTDQVAASFDRLLNHTPTGTAPAVPAALAADADPLRSSLNVVLWEKPSYHLPAKYAVLSPQSKSKK